MIRKSIENVCQRSNHLATLKSMPSGGSEPPPGRDEGQGEATAHTESAVWAVAGTVQ